MQAQEIFDKALGGVIRQGDLSIDPISRSCFYRYPGKPMACGVGHLLDEETARKWDEIQDQGLNSQINHIPKHLIPGELLPHMEMLKKIQLAHDGAVGYDDPVTRLTVFLRAMEHIAKFQGLEMKFSEKDIEEALA